MHLLHLKFNKFSTFLLFLLHFQKEYPIFVSNFSKETIILII